MKEFKVKDGTVIEKSLPTQAIIKEKILWDGSTTTGANGVSKILDIEYCPNLSVFGVVTADTTLTFEISYDGTDFYECGVISSDLPQSGQTFPQDFHIDPTIGARYIRLRSTNDVTVEAYAQAKE